MTRIRPFNGNVVITQEYGSTETGTRRGYHTGVDYGLSVGHEIVAPENGVVKENGDGRAASDGRGFYTLFLGDSGVMHCLYHQRDLPTIFGRIGIGGLLGYTGNTGASTGAHLHWETRKAPYDGYSDFAPGTWLFGEQAYVQPIQNAPVQLSPYVRIFGDYRTFYATPGGRVITKLLPSLGGGSLDYPVLERSGNFVKIQRKDGGGQGWLYVGADVANLTQFYSA